MLFGVKLAILFFCGKFCQLYGEEEPAKTSDASPMNIYYKILKELGYSPKPYPQLSSVEAIVVIGALIGRYDSLKRECDSINKTYREMLINSDAQAKLEYLRLVCNDVPKGNTAKDTWLNILQQSKRPHAMALRHRIKLHGLTYQNFAVFADVIEKFINDKRHPPPKMYNSAELKEAVDVLETDPCHRAVITIILTPFPESILNLEEKDGLFGKFVCLEIRKIPGQVEVDKIKDEVKKSVPNLKSEDIHFRYIFNSNGQGKPKFTGKGYLCFNDHETAYSFWRDTSLLRLKEQNLGFGPVEGTKETLWQDAV